MTTNFARLHLEPLHNEPILLDQLSNSSEQAFRGVYDAYSGAIYAVAMRHLKEAHLAEDIVQTVFLKVWESRATLKDIRHFSSWLFTISRNTIISTLRKQGSHETYRNYLKTRSEVYAESPEAVCIKRDIRCLIEQAVTELSPQQRLAFQLQRDEGLSYDAIGERMGIATNTVRAHLYRANQFIRSYLQTHGVDSVAVMLAVIFFC
ncbi:MAG: RNA polymerase sigma factor [Agriterribacter sp.]